MITYYVQSAGKGRGKDYTWVRVDDQAVQDEHDCELIKETPPFFRTFPLEEMLDLNSFALVLGRSGELRFLLVTRLETGEPKRPDGRGRLIDNSFACISGRRDEATLRGIAARVLRSPEEAGQEIGTWIQSDDTGTTPFGFTVKKGLITQLGKYPVERSDNVKDGKSKIGAYARRLFTDLANTLATETLPQKQKHGDQLLVIVNKEGNPERIKKARPWRALSATLDPKTKDEKLAAWRYLQPLEQWISLPAWTAVILGVLLLILLLAFILIHLGPFHQGDQRQTPVFSLLASLRS